MLKDTDIREPLFLYLEGRYGKVRIIEEKTIGKSRADVVMVTEDALTGIEIKSDADTYTRLKRQVRDYDRIFDYNILVIGSHHAHHAAEHVPAHWGIISAEWFGDRMDFYEIRPCTRNPKSKPKEKLKLLWRPELSRIQELNGMHKYKQKSKAFVIDKIAECVEPEVLNRQISDELFERDYTTIAEEIAEYRQNNR